LLISHSEQWLAPPTLWRPDPGYTSPIASALFP
jgi:hypothetical protein